MLEVKITAFSRLGNVTDGTEVVTCEFLIKLSNGREITCRSSTIVDLQPRIDCATAVLRVWESLVQDIAQISPLLANVDISDAPIPPVVYGNYVECA